MRRSKRCPVHPARSPHDDGHRFAPSWVGGYWSDGSARTWVCDCGARIRFQPWPPVTVRAR